MGLLCLWTPLFLQLGLFPKFYFGHFLNASWDMGTMSLQFSIFPCLVKPRPVDLQEFKMIHAYIALSLSQFVKGREARVLLATASWVTTESLTVCGPNFHQWLSKMATWEKASSTFWTFTSPIDWIVHKPINSHFWHIHWLRF